MIAEREVRCPLYGLSGGLAGRSHAQKLDALDFTFLKYERQYRRWLE